MQQVRAHEQLHRAVDHPGQHHHAVLEAVDRRALQGGVGAVAEHGAAEQQEEHADNEMAIDLFFPQGSAATPSEKEKYGFI